MKQHWNIVLPYAFLPFSIISRVLLKIKQECVPLLILIAEYPTMVPRTLKSLCQRTSAAAPGKKNSNNLLKYCLPIDGIELIDTSGLVGFRKTLLYEGILEKLG